MRRKPVVGETLYRLNVGNEARNTESVLTPVKVTKVGRKYFTCVKEGYFCGTDYHIDTWREKTEYCVNSMLYENPQEWLDIKESGALCKQICRAFEYGSNKRNLPLDTLKQIWAIIEREPK